MGESQAAGRNHWMQWPRSHLSIRVWGRASHQGGPHGLTAKQQPCHVTSSTSSVKCWCTPGISGPDRRVLQGKQKWLTIKCVCKNNFIDTNVFVPQRLVVPPSLPRWLWSLYVNGYTQDFTRLCVFSCVFIYTYIYTYLFIYSFVYLFSCVYT